MHLYSLFIPSFCIFIPSLPKVTSKDCLGNFQGKYKDLFHYANKKIAEALPRQILTSPSAGNGRFWQQNVIQDRKSFITQSKLMIFWWNKKFLKAYDLLLLSPEKKIELDFGHGLCWPSFCPNRVLKEQFVKALAIFFQNYNIVT